MNIKLIQHIYCGLDKQAANPIGQASPRTRGSWGLTPGQTSGKSGDEYTVRDALPTGAKLTKAGRKYIQNVQEGLAGGYDDDPLGSFKNVIAQRDIQNKEQADRMFRPNTQYIQSGSPVYDPKLIAQWREDFNNRQKPMDWMSIIKDLAAKGGKSLWNSIFPGDAKAPAK